MTLLDGTPMPSPLRVFVLDRTKYQADALGLLLSAAAGLELLGTSADPLEALRRLETGGVDVLLVHAADGVAAVVREVKERRPEQRVVVLGLDDDLGTILRLIEFGAGGYLLRDAAPDEVIRAVEAVCAGQAFCPPRLAAAAFRRLWQLARAARTPAESLAHKLSAREQEVLALIGQGLANKQIARRLDITLCTVKNHVHRILDKLRVSGRHEAVRVTATPRATSVG